MSEEDLGKRIQDELTQVAQDIKELGESKGRPTSSPSVVPREGSTGRKVVNNEPDKPIRPTSRRPPRRRS